MATDNRVVETTHGMVRGAEDGGIATWKIILGLAGLGIFVHAGMSR